MTKQEMFLNLVKQSLGAPMVGVELEDTEILTQFLIPALVMYYRRCPWQWREEVSSSGGESVVIKVPSVVELVPEVAQVGGFFVGVVYVERVGSVVSLGLEDFLLRGDVGIRRYSMEEELMERQAVAMVQDVVGVDLHVEYDTVKEELHISPFSGKVSVCLGYGFNTIEYVPWTHVEVVAMLASEKLLTTVINERGIISVQGDVSLNLDSLRDTLAAVRERLPVELETISVPMLLWA